MTCARRVLTVALFCAFSLASDGQRAETSFVNGTRTKLRILGVFGHLGKSHFDVFKPLMEELARRGHDVTVISHFPRSEAGKSKEPLSNYKDVDLADPNLGVFLDVVDLRQLTFSSWRLLSELASLQNMATVACERGLRNERLRKFIKEDRSKYDLIITESFNTDCFLGIMHKYKGTPYMGISSHQILPWTSARVGDPDEASYVANTFLGMSSEMHFFQRTINYLAAYLTRFVYDYCYYPSAQKLAEEAFGPGVPDIREIGKNATALLLNSHYSLHGPRPHHPNVVDVGGLHIPPRVNPLPEDIAKFLDGAPEGVIYFNLGSMIKASSMPQKQLDVILKVLESLPRKVIWKWETQDLPNKPKNVLVRKWMPQFDLLNHPNVRAYIGHGGLLGLSEGVYTGTPMVLIPMYGDQFYNAAAAEARGVAIVLEFPKMTEDSLRSAINEVFNNTRYRENAKKLSKAYRDRPAGPLETAVWWTEHIARGNGAAYLRNGGAKQPWYRRYLLDVQLFLLAVSLLFLYAAYQLIRLPLSSPRSRKEASPGATGDKGKWKKRD